MQTLIAGWSAVSALGVGRDAFRDGLVAATPTTAPVDTEQWSGLPVQNACLVPGFTVRGSLGPAHGCGGQSEETAHPSQDDRIGCGHEGQLVHDSATRLRRASIRV